ncbi:MAG: PrsW family glutamic-type intramembrane protease [Patescibacteria group bacterium]
MALLAIFLGLLPGFAWLLFYLREDLHPEPKRLIAFVFFGGALVTLLAFVFQCTTFTGLFGFKDCSVDLDTAIQSLKPFYGIILIIILALIEEVLKFGAAYTIAVRNANFDEPVDAMIYMVVAALGFATVENLAVSQKILSPEVISTGVATVYDAFRTISVRFIGATLLHTLASGIVGYYWARSIRNFESKRFLIWGLALATILHAFFNYLIINFDDRIYTVVLLFVVGFLVIGDFEKLKNRSI